ncbi:ThiF family adenylyltransferase [Allopusillimonas ginsengisoli]|uniref:tRNA threonylcarbamoyladenosine dehydratase n=1 Tax=Allopusillimonas ginsengisoli TaxID=453575 RepID=UPI0010C17DB5|nr:tRNA threonylcarbamoyladenosine dehydratase [Allopusillimonas ginsengisoli]
MTDATNIDLQRRFGGLERLYGAAGLSRLQGAHVLVAGIGGVGSWCAEALARSGVGAISLVDLDHVSESNINRQLHALTETVGQAKVSAMGQRVHGINPACTLSLIDDFINPENVSALIAHDVDLVIDCTDQAAAKIAMILECRTRKLPVVVCGGAGGKTDALALRAGDLSAAVNDALLSKLRNTLRRQHGFPRAASQAGKVRHRIPKMGVRVLWFDQPAILPTAWAQDVSASAASAPQTAALQGLSCAGYGSSVTVTAPMGMAAASEAIRHLLHGRFK